MVRRVWCVVAALVVAGACKKSGAGGQGGFGGGGPMAMPGEVAVARPDTGRDEIAATGQIEAGETDRLPPRRGGGHRGDPLPAGDGGGPGPAALHGGGGPH